MKTILTFVPRYLPGYKAGGQIRTVAKQVSLLGDDLDFRIVTSDRDSGETAPYPNVLSNRWNQVGKASVYYAKGGKLGFAQIRSIISQVPHDVVFLNGFFSYDFSIKPLLLRRAGQVTAPVVLAPHGEFSPGAIAIRWPKKRLFLACAQRIGLHKGILFKATSEFEKQHIHEHLGSATRVRVAMDFACVDERSAQSLPDRQRKKQGSLRAVFLSRIAPKKNLIGAIELLRDVKGEVHFDIYGPCEDKAYWGSCQAAIKKLPKGVSVNYRGTLNHSDVVPTLTGYDLFLFPTLGENFGHVIPEAMMAGLPVLLSDQTPWRQLEAKRVGWDIPLADRRGFVSALQWAIDADADTLQPWSEQARKLGLSHNTVDPGLVQQHRQTLEQPLAH